MRRWGHVGAEHGLGQGGNSKRKRGDCRIWIKRKTGGLAVRCGHFRGKRAGAPQGPGKRKGSKQGGIGSQWIAAHHSNQGAQVTGSLEAKISRLAAEGGEQREVQVVSLYKETSMGGGETGQKKEIRQKGEELMVKIREESRKVTRGSVGLV